MTFRDVASVLFNNNAGEIELWAHADSTEKNGSVLSFSPTGIKLYKIENGKTTLTKQFN